MDPNEREFIVEKHKDDDEKMEEDEGEGEEEDDEGEDDIDKDSEIQGMNDIRNSIRKNRRKVSRRCGGIFDNRKRRRKKRRKKKDGSSVSSGDLTPDSDNDDIETLINDEFDDPREFVQIGSGLFGRKTRIKKNYRNVVKSIEVPGLTRGMNLIGGNLNQRRIGVMDLGRETRTVQPTWLQRSIFREFMDFFRKMNDPIIQFLQNVAGNTSLPIDDLLYDIPTSVEKYVEAFNLVDVEKAFVFTYLSLFTQMTETLGRNTTERYEVDFLFGEGVKEEMEEGEESPEEEEGEEEDVIFRPPRGRPPPPVRRGRGRGRGRGRVAPPISRKRRTSCIDHYDLCIKNNPNKYFECENEAKFCRSSSNLYWATVIKLFKTSDPFIELTFTQQDIDERTKVLIFKRGKRGGKHVGKKFGTLGKPIFAFPVNTVSPPQLIVNVPEGEPGIISEISKKLEGVTRLLMNNRSKNKHFERAATVIGQISEKVRRFRNTSPNRPQLIGIKDAGAYFSSNVSERLQDMINQLIPNISRNMGKLETYFKFGRDIRLHPRIISKMNTAIMRIRGVMSDSFNTAIDFNLLLRRQDTMIKFSELVSWYMNEEEFDKSGRERVQSEYGGRQAYKPFSNYKRYHYKEAEILQWFSFFQYFDGELVKIEDNLLIQDEILTGNDLTDFSNL